MEPVTANSADVILPAVPDLPTINSPAGSMHTMDWGVWAKDALIYGLPIVAVVIPVVIQMIPSDWAYATIATWILGRILEYIQLRQSQTTYTLG